MSSDLYAFEASELASNVSGDFSFFSDPYHFHSSSSSSFSALTHTHNLHLHEDETQTQTPFSPSSLDPFSSSFFSFSPPSTHLQSLSLYHSKPQTLHPPDSSVFHVKNEESHLLPDTSTFSISKLMMQRSFSSHSFDANTAHMFNTPHYEIETPTFQPQSQNQALCPPDGDNTFLHPQLRRVCSTGDLQVSTFIYTLYSLYLYIYILVLYIL